MCNSNRILENFPVTVIYIYIKKKNFKKSCHMLSKIFGLSTLPIYTVCVPILVNKILGVVCILH